MSHHYTLYFDYLTSAFVPHVMLDEIDAKYDLAQIDTTIDAHETIAFRALYPNMLIPTLGLPDGRTFGENGAILLILGELHPESGLVPQTDDIDRPFFLHWLFALATTGHTTIRRYSYPEEYTVDPSAQSATTDAAKLQLFRFFDALEDAISGNPWFMKRGFGPLDIYTIMVCIVLTGDIREDVFATRPKLKRLYWATHRRETVRKLWEFYRFPTV